MKSETLPSSTTDTAQSTVVPGRLVFHRDEPSRFGAIEVMSQDGLVKGLSMKQHQILPFEPEALLTAAQLAEVIIDLAGKAATPASADQLAAYARTLAEAYGAHSQAGDLAVGDFAFYHEDPDAYGPLAIQAVASKVSAYSKYKELELDFDQADLSTADQLAEGLICALAIENAELRQLKVSAHATALAAAFAS
ncbi:MULTISPECIES: hypothetical protein [Pseudomonas]|jgi:hypothetical protein|uniref:Uncharacterized protein n=1 Tax=Pseudomonas oryzihabitans TaxID=47885 RepID=A0A178LGM6_9PSED|nr:MULTISPECIES: hypothetical protein [Pseudomonas]HCV78274.1 hypothetical protein [Pseudomonas sp.]EHK68774.1 hypothetical protein PPL19_22354 [Pseudomonas psychrotolerans L19]MBA1182944.1 hypothetical protein [Pseudomonas psychrotolerans]MBA1214252.1 hypothetical protein [Pseudomonas psychrotolerans]MDC7832012.1 hypothetical protein [Pseudomonas benzopyrenica]